MNGISFVISECVKHTIENSWFIFFIGIYVNYKIILITAVYHLLNVESESGSDLGGVCTYAPITAAWLIRNNQITCDMRDIERYIWPLVGQIEHGCLLHQTPVHQGALGTFRSNH